MGGFAEYEYVVPRTEVVKIPEELTDEEAIGVGCAFRTIVAAYERLGGIDIQDDVLIQGAGPVGLYALAQAIESGARKTIVVGAPKARLDLAKRWGADYVINIDEVTDPSKRKDQILELTSGRGPDIVVECTGVPAAFSEGVEIIRKGGRYLVIGQVSEATTAFAPSSIVFKSLDIIGTLSATIPHYYKALQFVKNKRAKYPFAEIVSNKYSLEQVNEALAAMKAGREMKPVIDNRGR
jgi:threonine dehydrogenase-like Zn-dependent dehydrogenase